MKNYRKLLAGSLALFLAVGITGCSNTSGGGTGVANEDGLVVLNVASTNQPVSFDPADANLVVNEYNTSSIVRSEPSENFTPSRIL